jgi:transmembrane sensor
MKRERTIEKQAALWADRRQRREMDAAAEAELRAWLAGGPERAALLQAHEQVLSDPALAHAQAMLEPVRVRPRRQAQGWRWATTWGAGLALAGLAAFIVVLPTQQAVVRQSFEAPVGHPLQAALDDGSLVQLNGGSDIKTTFDARKRDVHLRGEGFFAVAKDAERPFSVFTASHRVTALGTRFNVDERSNGAVEITVVDGRIKNNDLKSPKHRVVLTAGHRIVAGNAPLTPSLTRRVTVDAEAPDWTQGWIDADDMRLADLLLELQRQAPGLQVGLGDPTLAGRRVSGRFKATDPQEVLAVVAETQRLRLRTEASGRVLLVY